MSFLPKAQRYTRDGIVAYILALPKTGFRANPHTGVIWNPVGVTLHNTAQPDIKEWMAYSQAQKESWGDNLNRYYVNMGWHSGPHFAATPEAWSYVLCDLMADGVHDSCRNSNYYGIEMVGNFEVHADDPNSVEGKQVISNAVNILAALHVRFGWDPDKLDFHRRCTRDHHPCPGSLIPDEMIISALKVRIAEIKTAPPPIAIGPLGSSQPHADTPLIPTIILPEWPPLPAYQWWYNTAARIYNKWKSFGVSNQFALAMLAQAEAESSFQVKAAGDKVNGEPTAFGIYQNHTDRCAVIKKATGIDLQANPPPSVEQECQAAWWELNATEKKAFDKITAATTANDASIAACVYFERAGAPAAALRRGSMAERWATYFTQNPDILKNNPPQNG